MGFWFFMLAMDLLIPAIMLIIGYRFSRKAPGKINLLVGYRTTRSMKNEDTWEFANTLCGRLWKKWGWWTLLPSAVPMLFVIGQGEEIVAMVGLVICFLQLIPLLAVIPKVEAALKKTFDKDGNRL